MEDLLDCVAQSVWLSKVDLNRGFYQVPMKESSREKTAFCSPWGKYEFTRMPFGLQNSPATFQRAIDQAIGTDLSHTAAYIDDLLTFSNSWSEH